MPKTRSQTTISDLEDLVRVLKGHLSTYEGIRRDSVSNMFRMEDANRKLVEENASLMARVQLLEEKDVTIQQLRTALEARDKIIESLESSLRLTEYGVAEAKIIGLGKKIDVVTSDLTTERKKNADLQQENKTLTERLNGQGQIVSYGVYPQNYISSSTEDYYLISKKSYLEVNSTNVTLVSENSNLKTRCEELQKELNECKIRASECEAQITALTSENGRLMEMKKETIYLDKNAIDEMKSTIDMMKSFVGEMQLKKNIVEYEETIQRYSDEVKHLRHLRIEENNITNQKTNEIWCLKDELKKQREYIIEIQQIMCEMILEQRN